MVNLYGAHSHWAHRPADERFETVRDLHEACVEFRRTSVVAKTPWEALKVTEHGGKVAVMGTTNAPARLTHHAFSQLCNHVGAPSGYLRQLPLPLVIRNLEHGLEQRVKDASSRSSESASLLLRENGALMANGILTDLYARIWNEQVTNRLLGLEAEGWRVPPARPAKTGQPGSRPATEADVLRDKGFGLSIKVGDLIAPAGLYAWDAGMFAFMVNEKDTIDAGGNDGALARGFFIWNSEVGDKSLGLQSFRYQHVCGNHIVWGAKDVKILRIRHVGEAHKRAAAWLMTVEELSKADAKTDELRVKKAKQLVLGKTSDEVLDLLFGRKVLSRATAKLAYGMAEQHAHVHGDPHTAWGMASGITRLSQTLDHMDERVEMDRAAGKVLAFAD